MNLQSIERELNVDLPKDYKDMILNYPANLPQSGFWSESGADEFLKHYQMIVELNFMAREDLGVSHNYFLIGGSGSGDYFFIDLDQKKSSVYYWNHEKKSFEIESPSLHEHIKCLTERYKDHVKNT